MVSGGEKRITFARLPQLRSIKPCLWASYTIRAVRSEPGLLVAPSLTNSMAIIV